MVVPYLQNYARGYIHGHYHGSSDCSEYPKKSLRKSSHPKRSLSNFPTQKNPWIKILNPQKILWSSPSVEIGSTTTPPFQYFKYTTWGNWDLDFQPMRQYDWKKNAMEIVYSLLCKNVGLSGLGTIILKKLPWGRYLGQFFLDIYSIIRSSMAWIIDPILVTFG